MINIKCSENCIYSVNGICTLENISEFSNQINTNHTCAYFVDKNQAKNSPTKKN